MPQKMQRPGGNPGRVGSHLQLLARNYLAKFYQAQDRLNRALLRHVWVLEYSRELRRQDYAESRARLRESCMCVALVLIRLAGVRT